jgi:hypothetical protein
LRIRGGSEKEEDRGRGKPQAGHTIGWLVWRSEDTFGENSLEFDNEGKRESGEDQRWNKRDTGAEPGGQGKPQQNTNNRVGIVGVGREEGPLSPGID